MTRAATIAVLCCFALTGCGFQPLFGDQASGPVVENLSTIDVGPIDDRLGQQVRNRLIDRLTPRGLEQKQYDLAVDLESRIDGFGFRSDRSVTREEVTLTARYQLRDAVSGEPRLEKQAVARVSYDVVQSDFANVNAQRDAQRRAAAQLVETIVQDLALFVRQTTQGEAAR